MNYIHQLDSWPLFEYKLEKLLANIHEIDLLDSKLKALMGVVGIEEQTNLELEATITEIVKNFEIEQVRLDADDVRSSLLKKLGLDTGFAPTNRNTDGYVEASLDAIKNPDKTLTDERLFRWHNALFYTGKNEHGLEVIPGKYRTVTDGAMIVKSGNLGREKIHYQAPDGALVQEEMSQFIRWFNEDDTTLKPVIKSAIAHLWLVTIHPFGDGNGRMSRIISDMAISKSNNSVKYYSISEQIVVNKKEYNTILEKTQKQQNLDVTDFVFWYAEQTLNALYVTEKRIEACLFQVKFWDKNRHISLNNRQVMCLNKLLKNELFNKLNTRKYADEFEISKETASRDLIDLYKKGVIDKLAAGGRETAYYIKELGIPDEEKFGKQKQRGFIL